MLEGISHNLMEVKVLFGRFIKLLLLGFAVAAILYFANTPSWISYLGGSGNLPAGRKLTEAEVARLADKVSVIVVSINPSTNDYGRIYGEVLNGSDKYFGKVVITAKIGRKLATVKTEAQNVPPGGRGTFVIQTSLPVAEVSGNYSLEPTEFWVKE